jgi:hypothetical protein
LAGCAVLLDVVVDACGKQTLDIDYVADVEAMSLVEK